MSRSSKSDKESDKDRTASSGRTVGSNTEVTGSEPYYSVPVLQNVLSEGGVTSRLYSLQVMYITSLHCVMHHVFILVSHLFSNILLFRTSELILINISLK